MLLRVRAMDEPITVRELTGETGLGAGALRRHLETLTARGLLRADVGAELRYRYAPTSPELRRYADALADQYAANRDVVVRTVLSRGARAFADAFKLRDDEKGDPG